MSAPLDPALADLRSELERGGNVVVPHGEFICVRLPLFASVRARVEAGQLRLDPQLGPFRRSRGLTLTLLAATGAGAGAFLVLGVAPAAFAVAFGAAGAMFADIARLVLTENCMTRMQLAWSVTDGARLAAGAASRPALPPSASTLSR